MTDIYEGWNWVVFPWTRIWLWASDSALAWCRSVPWLCVPLASIEQHLSHCWIRTSPVGGVPQPRRSSPQHQLAHAQSSWDQPSRRQRLPEKQQDWKEGRKEWKSDYGHLIRSKVTQIEGDPAKHWLPFYSPEGHLFKQVSIYLFWRRTLCLGVVLHRRGEKGRGAGRWEEVGGILRLWCGQV